MTAERLAQMLDVHVDVVIEALKRLEEKGLVKTN
jgi:Mn-dependent DtxR family transcriptional regulator